MDTNNTSVQVNEFQALKSLIIAVEALAHDNSFKSASTVLEENAQLRKQIDSQQAEITKLTEREKELEVIKENTYREMFNINEKEKTNNVKAHEEIESLKAQILENEQIIAELKRTTDRLEKEVQDAKLIYSEEKKKVVQAHEDITKMQKAIKDTESKTDQYKTAGSRLKREYESLQTKYKDMETSKSLVEEENKQKSLQLDEIQGYTVQFYNDTEAVLYVLIHLEVAAADYTADRINSSTCGNSVLRLCSFIWKSLSHSIDSR
jgi:chromosome segregation ATPase